MSKFAMQVIFDTEAQAKECELWFDGAGEQDWWVWADCRVYDGAPKGFGDFTSTSTVEIKDA